MLTVFQYGDIRRAFRDGMSVREIARPFQRSRRKIRQILTAAEPRPYTRTQPAPVLGAFHGVIDTFLADDEIACSYRVRFLQFTTSLVIVAHAATSFLDSARTPVGPWSCC
jgi:hypothetical protein